MHDDRSHFANPFTIDELLTILPYHVGFIPENQLFMALFDEDGRLPVIASTDLSAIRSPAAARWSRFAPVLRAQDIQAASIVLYGPSASIPEARAVAASCPVNVRDVVRVEGQRYWDLATVLDDQGVATSWQHSDAQAALCVASGMSAPPVASVRESLRPGTDPRTAQVETLVSRMPVLTAGQVQSFEAFELIQSEVGGRIDGPRPIDVGTAARILIALQESHIRMACIGWRDAAAGWFWNDLLHVTPPQRAANVLGLTALHHYFASDALLAHHAARDALALDDHQAEAILTTVLLSGSTTPYENADHAYRLAQKAQLELIDRGGPAQLTGTD